MITINTKIDKNMNFLMIIYQILKKQNLFEKLNFIGIENLKKEDTASIKKYLRENQNFELFLKNNENFKRIYEQNKKRWKIYWKENEEILLKIKNKFIKKIENYDFSIFEKVERFFDSSCPKEIEFFIFMGNEEVFGTGNAYSSKYATLFPRNFKNHTEKTLENDFAVLMHEIIHLCQNLNCKEDKELIEKIARFFAPRGILINEDKMKLNKEDLEIYDLVKKTFIQGKKYYEIQKELIKIINK